MDKYKEAGKIANATLQIVLESIKPNASVWEIAQKADAHITEQVTKVFNKKKGLEKGIAFPTSISKNEICGHYSPFKSDAEDKEKDANTLREGDIAKIDLGVHIDGFVALVAHTVVVQADKEKAVEGRSADVILAAYNAL